MAEPQQEFVRMVEELVRTRVNDAAVPLTGEKMAEALAPGKMLRTRLAARLVSSGASPAVREKGKLVCAATEIAHTATLCHDDIIDNAFLRRRQPALWRNVGANAAVLVGDLLLCVAFELIAQTGDAEYMTQFGRKLCEVCIAEAKEELDLIGEPRDEATCLRLARGTTGPLFAMVAWGAAAHRPRLAAALEEAGYLIGTAYQLADDLLDVVGDPARAGKTLRTDALRHKITLPVVADDGRRETRARIHSLCRQALDTAKAWPSAQSAIRTFFSQDLQPVLDRHIRDLDLLSMPAGEHP
ncbi:MAG: polyprenyl synthetase family protein [Candidatus Brocadiia bacterium]